MDIAIKMRSGGVVRAFRLAQAPPDIIRCENTIAAIEDVMVTSGSRHGRHYLLEVTVNARKGTDHELWLEVFSLVAAAADWQPGRDKVTTF